MSKPFSVYFMSYKTHKTPLVAYFYITSRQHEVTWPYFRDIAFCDTMVWHNIREFISRRYFVSLKRYKSIHWGNTRCYFSIFWKVWGLIWAMSYFRFEGRHTKIRFDQRVAKVKSTILRHSGDFVYFLFIRLAPRGTKIQHSTNKPSYSSDGYYM
jgi:hypothetical protein